MERRSHNLAIVFCQTRTTFRALGFCRLPCKYIGWRPCRMCEFLANNKNFFG